MALSYIIPFGFLVRDNGSFDNFFLKPDLTALALATLLPGALVACETVPVAPGPEVFDHARRLRPEQRAARPPASVMVHDRRARMMTTKGLDDDA